MSSGGGDAVVAASSREATMLGREMIEVRSVVAAPPSSSLLPPSQPQPQPRGSTVLLDEIHRLSTRSSALGCKEPLEEEIPFREEVAEEELNPGIMARRGGADASQEAARLNPIMELVLQTSYWPPSSSCGFGWPEMLHCRWLQLELPFVAPVDVPESFFVVVGCCHKTCDHSKMQFSRNFY